MENTPAVSVVIPLYNAERYFAECLDSLLMQTFQDYEIILVNDGSTDNSRAIAESYVPKFGGRLKLFDNEKNSGQGVTRNNGLRYATGEYVFFMDSDDLLLLNGLEKMYTTAKKFDVDIVDATRNYKMSNDGKTLTPVNLKATTPDNKFILESNLEWRVQGLLADRFSWAPWRRLLRRKFLIDNELFFPENLRRCEDEVWTHGLLFYAKKIIHIPIALYLYRMSEGSITYSKRTPLQNIISRMDNIFHDLQWIDDVMSKIPYFKKHPEYRYAILEHSTQRFFIKLFKSSLKISPSNMYASIKQEFGGNFGEYAVLVPILCTLINKYQRIIATDKQPNIANNKQKATEIELARILADAVRNLKTT